jgi:aminoglycoside 3-N-acetyltransferase
MAGSEQPQVARWLDEAGIPRDGVLFLHSAFRNLAQQGWQVEPFIDALLGHMRDGTLVMPTMSWRISNPANPFFDERETPSHVGIVPETFRLTRATHRSLHPTHSVGAAGKRAAHLTSTHHLDDTPCSPRSPYGKARAEDAHVIMLGIGLERCTAIHLAEEEVAPDVYLKPPAEAVVYSCRDRHGAVHPVRMRHHLPLNRDFPQFQAPLAAQGELRTGSLAGTPWIAFTQRDLLATVFAALEADPRKIIAPPGAPIIP